MGNKVCENAAKTIICQHCQQEFDYNGRNPWSVKFCSEHCKKDYRYNKKIEKYVEDCVICPICHKSFKEINNFHLATHNLTPEDFDRLYPDCERLSKLVDKNNFKDLSSEMSNKLKKSHTLEGYIEKYGLEQGTKKYSERLINMARCKTLEYYVEKYGNIDGKIKYEATQKSKGVTLTKYVNKYGEEKGKTKYNEWLIMCKKKNTIQHYMEKHGEEQGLLVWLTKNKKNSDSSRSIDASKISEYQKYCLEVDKETRLSIQLNNLPNIELRGKEFHLDHKVSKCYGFNNNIPTNIIGSIHNLEILSVHENCTKQKGCSITIEELNEKSK